VHFSDKVATNVEVAARLSPPLLSHLRAALEHEHALTVVRDWDELAAVVRSRPIDVVVADPKADGKLETAGLRTLLGRHPTVPVVVYTALTPETLKAAVELAKLGVQHVVLRGFDDEPSRLRELVERVPASRLSDIALRELLPRLDAGPALLKRAVTRLFESPHAFQSVDDLAVAAGMTRRNLDRWLDRLGLASARMLLLGARLTRAVYYMRDPGYLLDDITKKLGYPSARLFARQVRAATGLTPTMLRERAEPERLVEELTARLCRHGGSRR
jgi:AraC-like DNA-binding protein